jgi:hypothetical protein
VTDIRIAGETRSFGFIEYSTAEEATQGLALSGMVIKGTLWPIHPGCGLWTALAVQQVAIEIPYQFPA